jgi:putative zinc finger/helix-turn-helix YgiT family protein
MSNVTEGLVSQGEACALCESDAATLERKKQQFAYRDGAKEVLLIAEVPVWSCAACGEEYTGEGAEEAQHEAVCNYLGRLTPADIKALRQRHDLSQAELAQKTGIGIASIKRWEGGTVIQNASLDAQLRALDTKVEQKPKRSGRFKTEFTAEHLSRADRFRLRPCEVAA